MHFEAQFLEGKVLGKPNNLQQHTVVIAIHQNNIDKLQGILEDVSDMNSPNYGKHLTGEEVASMTADPLKTKAVIEHFTGKGAELVEQTANGEYITMRAPVGLWEETFSAAFEEVELASGERLLRSRSYSIPEELSVYIASVGHILQVFKYPSEVSKVTTFLSTMCLTLQAPRARSLRAHRGHQESKGDVNEH